MTDECKAILKSNQFNKTDTQTGQRGSDTKEREKRVCLHCVKYNGLNAEICIGRLGRKSYEKKPATTFMVMGLLGERSNQFRRV